MFQKDVYQVDYIYIGMHKTQDYHGIFQVTILITLILPTDLY